MPKFIVVFGNKLEDTHSEQRVFKNLKQALKTKGVTFAYLDNSAPHDWEQVGTDGKYQCKNCGLWGIKERKEVRLQKRYIPFADFGCRPQNLLENTLYQEKHIKVK